MGISRKAGRRRELGDPQGGVLISEIESDEAWRAGLRPGDVILMINNRAVENMDDFATLVEGLEPNRAVALRVWRNGAANFINFCVSAVNFRKTVCISTSTTGDRWIRDIAWYASPRIMNNSTGTTWISIGCLKYITVTTIA